MCGLQILCVLGHKITVTTSKVTLNHAAAPDRELFTCDNADLRPRALYFQVVGQNGWSLPTHQTVTKQYYTKKIHYGFMLLY